MAAWSLIASLAALLLTAPASAAAPRTFTVVIDKMKFGPVPASLKPGDSIVWINHDIFRHTATARNGRFNVDLPPKARAKTLIRSPGQIAFFCKYHSGMTGVLRVVR